MKESFLNVSKYPKYYLTAPPLLRMNLQTFSDPGGQGGEPPALTLEAIQNFVASNDEAKGWLNTLTQTRVSDAITDYETNTLPKKVEDEISKRYPAETAEQKALRDLKLQIQKMESDKAKDNLKSEALKIASNKELPVAIVEFFIGDDEASTLKNIGVLEEAFKSAVKTAVDAEVEKRFGQSGRNPNPGGSNGSGGSPSYGQLIATEQSKNSPSLEEQRSSFFK